MLVKGSEIVMKKVPLGVGCSMFNVGHTFEVTSSSDDLIITFRCEYGIGMMEYDEFKKYFTEKEIWSDWECHDPTGAWYRVKGRKVQVMCTEFGFISRATAKCSPCDDFDLDFGIKLAYHRASLKNLMRESLRRSYEKCDKKEKN